MINFIKTYLEKLKKREIIISDEDLKAEITFYNFLKNKKVIIVGPSPWMNGKSFGEKIDSYDVVIRINQGIFLPNKNSEDYGTKTDVIYTSQRARDEYINKNSDLSFPVEFNNVKFIAVLIQRKHSDFPTIQCFLCNKKLEEGDEYCLNSDWLEVGYKNIGHVTCIHNDKNYYKYKIPIVKRDVSLYIQYYRSSLLSGMLALIDCLQFETKHIDILGFDFYDGIKTMLENKSPDIKGNEIYCSGYDVFADTMRLSHKDEDGKQLFLLGLLMKEYSNIGIDEHLNEIMKNRLNYKNKNEYVLEYEEFIKNKKVIIVGPAPYLQGKKMGKFIDSFDIVVRINMGHKLCDNIDDYGIKKDVVYINQKIREKIGLDFVLLKDYKYICVQSFSEEGNFICDKCGKEIIGECFFEESFPFGIAMGIHQTKIHWKCHAFTNYSLIKDKIIVLNSSSMKKYLGEIPLTGLSAISHIQKIEPSMLYITGFDFFNILKIKKGNIRIEELYAPNYGLIDLIDLTMKDVKSKQLNLFKKLYKCGKINIDDDMKKILNF